MAMERAALLIVALLASYASADPNLWAAMRGPCLAHPTTRQLDHAAPVPDPSTSITVLDSSNSPVTSFCPGATYTVTVTYGSGIREAYITSTYGVFSSAAKYFSTDTCTNRFLVLRASPTASSSLTLPCSAAMPNGAIQIYVTSSVGEFNGFQTAGLTLPIDPSCGVGACQVAVASPPPNSPPPLPPLPPPSPSPPPRVFPFPPSPAPPPPFPPLPPSPPPPSPLPPSPPTPLAPVDPALVLDFIATLEADYDTVAATNHSLSQFVQDYISSCASLLGVDKSQIALDGDPMRGSIVVSTLVFAPSSDQVEALTLKIGNLVQNGTTVFPSSEVGQKYGITSAAVTSLAYTAYLNANSDITANSSLACTPSSLGYQCSLQAAGGAVTVHWTLGTSQMPPSNPCTSGANTAGFSATAGSGQILHMAMESTTTGYVGLGFSAGTNMIPSDVVIGSVSGTTVMVNSWTLSGSDYYQINPSNFNALPWAYAMGVTQTFSPSAKTTICLSRPLVSPHASVSSALDPNALQLIYAGASNGVVDLSVTHPTRGSISIDLVSGSSSAKSGNNKWKLNLHGALMAAGWALMLPLGVLIARHRWVFGETKLFGLHVWFRLHIFFQCFGLALVLGGFISAWALFNSGVTPGGQVGTAHVALGYVVLGLATLQFCLAFIRPHPASERRPIWNFIHHNLGRLGMAASWATIYLGIYIAHGSAAYQASYVVWLVPVCVSMGLLVITDIVLSLMHAENKKPQPRSRRWKSSRFPSMREMAGRLSSRFGKSMHGKSQRVQMANAAAVDPEFGDSVEGRAVIANTAINTSDIKLQEQVTPPKRIHTTTDVLNNDMQSSTPDLDHASQSGFSEPTSSVRKS